MEKWTVLESVGSERMCYGQCLSGIHLGIQREYKYH